MTELNDNTTVKFPLPAILTFGCTALLVIAGWFYSQLEQLKSGSASSNSSADAVTLLELKLSEESIKSLSRELASSIKEAMLGGHVHQTSQILDSNREVGDKILQKQDDNTDDLLDEIRRIKAKGR